MSRWASIPFLAPSYGHVEYQQAISQVLGQHEVRRVAATLQPVLVEQFAQVLFKAWVDHTGRRSDSEPAPTRIHMSAGSAHRS